MIYQQSHIVAKQEDLVKGMINLALRNVFLKIFSKYFIHVLKSYDMGLMALFPLRRKACGILSSLKIHRLGPV
jgi:hypothetical protein